MAASTTDKFTKVGNPGSATTLAAPGYTAGVSTGITVGSTTNWSTDTKVYFAIDRAQVVNGEEERIAGTYCEFEGIVASATTITDMTKTYGTAQDYPAGSLTRVYIPVSSSRENALIDGLQQDHNAKGNHETLTDDNDNEWLERGQTASAVNHAKVTNAATGNKPEIAAAGGDTNIGLSLVGKGTGRVETDSLPPRTFADEATFDFVASGGVWSGDSYGSTRAASMTALVAYINGKRVSVDAVTARSFTASKDTYVDLGEDGTLDYNEVNNNAASPALAADHIRVAIIVTGASSIANVGSINQGQENKVLPIASSIPYAVTDSLGNLICNRSPQATLLGMRQIVSNFTTTSTSYTDITGLSVPIISDGLRKVRITFRAANISSTQTGLNAINLKLLEDGVDSVIDNGTQNVANENRGRTFVFTKTPSAGSHTYKVQVLQQSAGTLTVAASSSSPALLLVELV